ncbi:hypothetical protein BUALT_Bualt14G0133000 [Buddleja alternifolia]|uniref:SBP-type domain-containing protein n=1 Tax=Buddleja alternifolia TaxID=168488 RepID=A0AAV6WR88_9LAMI|nr:hypothetical protein BUALT_Bualt14G0133000 [Buddleja alternifolia]
METKLHNFYGPVPVVSEVGKKSSVEWDLNEWRWDGDLFMAAPLNSMPSDCRSRQFLPVGSNTPPPPPPKIGGFSDEVVMFERSSDREKRDLEKRRRRGFEVEEGPGSLNLKLGGQVYPITEEELDECDGKSGKKTKVTTAQSSRSVCQVEDCKADLSNAKDYHRRHKVCEVHSKANRALVGNVMQRFCQQCSRFHVLQEFDEGKRSCRRRLAGHNKRRRKTHPENVVSTATLNDERGSNYLLISLLRILSNIHSNSSDQTKDQDLLSHLLKNLGNLAGTTNERNTPGLLPVSQDLQDLGTSMVTAIKDPTGAGMSMPATDLTPRGMLTDNALGGVTHNASTSQSASLFPTKASNSVRENASDTTVGRTKLNNIDLNYVYDGSHDCVEDLSDTVAPENIGNTSPVGPLWLYKDSQLSSPPQNSANSGSTSSQSPSTSSGESRTDRIVFKLFGKDPSDFPLGLRKQILDWLSSSPTDIESYIRPGCIILTIYLRMDKSTWEEFFNSSVMDYSLDGEAEYICNASGQVVLDTPLPVKNYRSYGISSVKPIAVSVSEGVQFVVKGYNLCRPTSRLLCALEGKYLVQENCADMMGGADTFIEHDEIQSLGFSCIIPDIVGRGFIEVEDHGLSSSFLPFIVAEKDVCSEICTLESIIENGDTNEVGVRNQALDFIHEMGWLLHRSRMKFRLGETGGDVDLFPFNRFRWLIEFSVEHDWCAVVKKLLSILFDDTVDLGQQNSNRLAALLEIGLLHGAVRRNCRGMVEFLLKYHPSGVLGKTEAKHAQLEEGKYLFRPDAMGPGGLTPLHIAATLDGSENVLDALTEDPGSVGVFAWKNARDSSGLTPHEYACLRGHYSYIHLVQRKLNKKSGNGNVVVDIPAGTALESSTMKQQKMRNARKFGALESEKKMNCRECEQKLSYGSFKASVRIYRPAMLSMVAIAAVCVCTALLFKSSPEVKQLFGAVKKPVVSPPLGSYKANYDHYIESDQKTGPRHSKNIRVSPPIPQQVRGTSTTWCVVKPSTSQERLDQIIGYCCTQPRVDCKAIQAGGMCYLPPNKVSDASVVMNMYYSLNGKKPSSCFFEGSGLVVAQDPCKSMTQSSPFSLALHHQMHEYNLFADFVVGINSLQLLANAYTKCKGAQHVDI